MTGFGFSERYIYIYIYIYVYIYILKGLMVLTSSVGELMDDQMLQYYQIVLNINDRSFVAIIVYCKPLHTYELRSRQPLNGCK